MKQKSKSNAIKMSRTRTSYSKVVEDRICAFIASGLNLKQSAQASGISETSLRTWRSQHPGFAERVEAAREIMRAKILGKIRDAGAKDWRAWETYLRLAFAEYRFTNSQQVSVAIQNNTMEISDPERARLVEMRAKALAAKNNAIDAVTVDASDAREIALEAESKLASGESAEVRDPEPKRLRERPPTTVVERHDEQMRRMKHEGWRAANDSDEMLDD